MLNFTLAWIAIVFILLWLGNSLITKLFSRYLPWRDYGNIRFFTHLFTGILFSLIIINATYSTLKLLLTIDPPSKAQLIVMNVYGAIIFIPVFSLYFSLHFLRSWRKSALESERFQKESIRSQLESLKSHLDPHFLFNNLNILSSLIEADQKRSVVFLDKFSEVYRLLLKRKTEDLVTLGDEMKFIHSYCYLVETRFSESIIFNISIADYLHAWMLPPMTLQMLVENAIKHNAITEKKPLKILITSVDDQVVISNSLNAKTENGVAKSGSGLDNIRKRYEYYTRKEVMVEKSETEFSVTIPLLEASEV